MRSGSVLGILSILIRGICSSGAFSEPESVCALLLDKEYRGTELLQLFINEYTYSGKDGDEGSSGVGMSAGITSTFDLMSI